MADPAEDKGKTPDKPEGQADGSFAGEHPDRPSKPIFVGPATEEQKNAVRPEYQVVACWRLDDIRFDFDSSFVRPESYPDFRLLAALLKEHPKAPVSVFGHADPVGQETYNKKLSGRRAVAVYSVLTRNIDLWDGLYTNPYQGDRWGNSQILTILDALAYTPADKDGLKTGAASDALKKFQSDNKLTAHGYLNVSTRRKLFEKYMDRLCGPFKLQKTDFLAKGADKDLRGDVQGCSEFNPLVILSKTEYDEYDKPENHLQRNAVNAPNRRVLVLLFKPGTQAAPADWPCPKADTTAVADCRSRFWAHGDDRLQNGPKRRTYTRNRNTFACRFYQRLLTGSPCEQGQEQWVLRILVEAHGAIPGRHPLANETYKLEGTGGTTINSRTDQNGFLRAPVTSDTADMTLTIAGLTIPVSGGALHYIGEPGGVKERLYNLGYGDRDFDAWTDDTLHDAVKAFQKDHQLTENGDPDDDATQDKLQQLHGS